MIEIAPGRMNFISLKRKYRVSNLFSFCLVFYLLNLPPAVGVIKNDISYKMISLYSHFSTNLLVRFFLDTGFKFQHFIYVFPGSWVLFAFYAYTTTQHRISNTKYVSQKKLHCHQICQFFHFFWLSAEIYDNIYLVDCSSR